MESEVKWGMWVIGLACIVFGLVIGYYAGRESQFDVDSSADKIEFMLDNYDQIPMVSTYITGDTSLEYLSYVYNLKRDKARGMLKILVSGICLS